jgi:hypothetical protein
MPMCPHAKRECGLAIVDHLLESPASQEYCQQSLALAAGVLQSLVEVTHSGWDTHTSDNCICFLSLLLSFQRVVFPSRRSSTSPYAC